MKETKQIYFWVLGSVGRAVNSFAMVRLIWKKHALKRFNTCINKNCTQVGMIFKFELTFFVYECWHKPQAHALLLSIWTKVRMAYTSAAFNSVYTHSGIAQRNFSFLLKVTLAQWIQRCNTARRMWVRVPDEDHLFYLVKSNICTR